MEKRTKIFYSIALVLVLAFVLSIAYESVREDGVFLSPGEDGFDVGKWLSWGTSFVVIAVALAVLLVAVVFVRKRFDEKYGNPKMVEKEKAKKKKVENEKSL
ncbi:hypothetical protein CMI47_20895 [Candidatus Pacearchaeota archaeon]|nr:hypothetical protein [Candidatus Pacearchaeota archaeon]